MESDHIDTDSAALGETVELEANPVRSYPHVAERVFDRPWALSGGPSGSHPELLSRMVMILRRREAGDPMGADEIHEAIAAARAENGDRAAPKPYDVAGSVAVIPVYGLISQRAGLFSDMSGGTSVDGLRNSLREALADPQVSSIVLDVDSPGGSVDGIPELAAEIRQARAGAKAIVAQVNVLSASAAYWLASQANEIVVTPSGEVGSIGVYAVHEDWSKHEEMAGIKTTFISAGKYKVEGNSSEPLSDEARAAVQEQVDDFYQMFVADVAKGRGVSTSVAGGEAYGQGRTLLAKKALAAGMVDRIATLEETVNRLQPSARSARRAAAVIPIQPAAVAAATPDRAWNARVAKRIRTMQRRTR